MSASVFSLPAPLILLIHLHLLQYPHANRPEYDHNVFDAQVRGLRDRTRTMEDVCYFLVAKIEGTKDRVRKVISTYPCLQPADTAAFRSSLAKYLENLRHTSIPQKEPSSKSRPNGKTISPVAGARSVAWWWKDVVVRKSLLEECAGERFERLVLALSTQALRKGSAIHAEPDETVGLLRSQPRVYMTRLAAFQTCRNSWVKTAALLDQRQYDLRVLRANVQVHSGNNRYKSLSTEKLAVLAESKLRDILAAQWTGPSGYSALQFLTDLFGLRQPDSTSPSVIATDGSTVAVAVTPPSPLPIAAAHHPVTLRNLSKRVFPKDVAHILGHTPIQTVASRPQTAAIALASRVDAEGRMRQALTDGLARTRKITSDLKIRFARRIAAATRKPALRSVSMNLWQENNHELNVDFEPTLSDASFVALGLPAPSSKSVTLDFGLRIHAIRQALLPQYPPIAISSSSLEPTIARPDKIQSISPPQTPRSSRQLLELATAPETVRPQTRYTLSRDRSKQHPSIPLEATATSEFGSDRTGAAATPRAHLQENLLTITPPPSLRRALDLGADYPAGAQYYPQDDDDSFGEGPSMSVRDLLLQADTTQFDIIDDDDSNELGDQSLGWA
ncbi:hypothetical protein MVEN_01577000 [Mycena venus]|uniref:HAUS augmin-like complex subunit 6 N-terminal domain-containing protein n=1 Tax=Mycena venus TaxID=2733690 RepID=A0A8H7CS88_9AGAR|nr:hypothetical protein MVEN_01577000 [Mycena venus]